MLWKNAFVVAVLFSGAYFALAPTCPNREERQWFMSLFAICLANLMALFVPMPYFAGSALFVASFLFLTWQGLPLIASLICLTAVTPQFTYAVSGVAGIQTLITLSTPVLMGFTTVIARVLFPKAFVRRRWTTLDWVVLAFIVTLGVVYSRGAPATTIGRTLIESLASLGAFYFVASRGRTGSPMFVLRAIMLVGVSFAAIAVAEALMRWLQFTGTAELRGAVTPYLSSPYAVQRFGSLRAILTFTDSIACSIFLSMTFICGLALYLSERRNRLIWLGATVLILLGTLVTFSRTGVIVISVGAGVYLLLARRYVYTVIFAAACSVAMFGISVMQSAESAGTIAYRSRLLELIPIVARKNLIFGDIRLLYLSDATQFVQGQGLIDLVNTFLGYFVIGGVLLCGLFVAIPVLAIRQLRGLLRERDQTSRVLYRKCALAICVALYVGLIFTSPTDKNVMYVLFAAGLLRGIGASQHATSRDRQRAGSAARPHPQPEMLQS